MGAEDPEPTLVSGVVEIDGVIESFGGWPGACRAGTEDAGKPTGPRPLLPNPGRCTTSGPTGDADR